MVGTVSPEAETGRKWRKVGGNHFVGVVGVLLRPQSATVMRYEGRKVVAPGETVCDVVFRGVFRGVFREVFRARFACFAQGITHVSRTFRARFAGITHRESVSLTGRP